MLEFCRFSELHKIKQAAGSLADFEYIKREVEKGVSRFVNICGVYFILRVDGRSLTVVCAQGRNLKQASYIVIKLAKKLGLTSILFHTQRPALARLLKHCNFKFFETAPSGFAVYRMVLNG
ncbi:hypothetical protein [Idiomarina abyssalis]|uniref:hypothetical protein n=1 Tax=Idiomarina abyssalis TaxID=86102 RepID=UPI003A905F47